MNIELKLNKDFERCVESLVSEFGEDFEILNGFHNSQLNFSDFIDSFVKKNLAEVTIDNNASSSNRDIVSLCSEKGKPSDKLIAFSKIFQELKKRWGLATAQEWLRAEWVGAFYLHDAPSATYKPYCYAYDLSRLAREGLFFLDKYNNKPAEHLTTFTDNLIEYISFMCNRSSGAVGIPNVLVWTMYFWKKDIDNNYYIRDPEYYLRQTFQKLIYRLNQPFMRLDQSAFVNVSIFDKYYYEALFGGLVFPDGSYAIDYLDMFIEHEKIFMEVVSNIRQENMFTFPVLTYSLLKRKNISQEEVQEMLRTRKFNIFMDNEFARWCSDHNCQWNDSNFFMSDDVTTLSNCCFDGSQELYYYDSNSNKILTTFKQFVESKLSEGSKCSTEKIIEEVAEGEAYIIDPNTGKPASIKAVTRLPNFHHKLVVIEKEDGTVLKVTPDQKIFDNNSKTLVTASEILKNPEKYYMKIRKTYEVVSEDYVYDIEVDTRDHTFMIGDTRVENCRLLSDTSKLSGFVNSIGGTALSVGSLKVNTINLMHIVYELEGELDETDYLKILKKRTKLCCKVLDRVRHIITRNIEKGLLPNYCDGGIELSKQYCTVGILGLYEVMVKFGYIETDDLGNHFYTDKGIKFADKIFKVINEVKDAFTTEYSFNIESVPAERAAVILCGKDSSLFNVNEFELYSNQWIPLTAKCTINEKVRTAAILDNKCSGGAIAHINIESNFPNTEEAWNMLNYIATTGVIYFCFNTRINVCKKRHAFVGTDVCPVCGDSVYDTYQRVVGFLTPSKAYSKPRQKEFSAREWFDTAVIKGQASLVGD